jgi:hypothetical protein
MPITHSWNGTVLTITSDAGTSSADLKGDSGCRGPQGPAGIVYGEMGDIVLEGYATEQYVNDLLNDIDVDVDLTDLYTKSEVDAKIVESEAYLEEYVDSNYNNITSNFATKNEVNSKITYGTADLTAGVSNLAPGVLYCVIEE